MIIKGYGKKFDMENVEIPDDLEDMEDSYSTFTNERGVQVKKRVWIDHQKVFEIRIILSPADYEGHDSSTYGSDWCLTLTTDIDKLLYMDKSFEDDIFNGEWEKYCEKYPNRLAEIVEELSDSSIAFSKETISKFVKYGIDLNKALNLHCDCEKPVTFLEWACKYRDAQFVTDLVECGADPNLKSMSLLSCTLFGYAHSDKTTDPVYCLEETIQALKKSGCAMNIEEQYIKIFEKDYGKDWSKVQEWIHS